MAMRTMSWRRFGVLVAGLSPQSAFATVRRAERERMGALADVDASDPAQLRGAF